MPEVGQRVDDAVSCGGQHHNAQHDRIILIDDGMLQELADSLRSSQILFRHVLRASFPPILSIIALQTGFLLGGTVING